VHVAMDSHIKNEMNMFNGTKTYSKLITYMHVVSEQPKLLHSCISNFLYKCCVTYTA